MIYSFICVRCDLGFEVVRTMAEGPPPKVVCKCCGVQCLRDWKADAPMIDTSGCKDVNFIPHEKRVASAWDRGSEAQIEGQFKSHIQRRRQEIRDAGGQRGSIKQSHSVPAHLYHGKKKETGDAHYWEDPKNLNKHKECKVE